MSINFDDLERRPGFFVTSKAEQVTFLPEPERRARRFTLISVDDHIAEPADMFDGHVPEKYREFVPRVVDEPDGGQQWYYGDVRGRNLGLNAVAGKPPEMFNVNPNRYEDRRPGCFDVHERVRDMSAGGQLAGLNFPNWTGFSGQVLNQGPDRDVNLVMIQAYNDWHVDEWCAAHPGRFIPMGLPVLWDAELAAAEVRRLAEDLDATLTEAMRAAYAAQRAEIGPRGYDDRIFRRKAMATPKVHALTAEAEHLLTLRETHRLNDIPEVPFEFSPLASPVA